MGLFERNFMKVLKEDCKETEDRILQESCRSTFHTDKLGKRVEVPYGGSYAVGKNGKGKGIRKGNTAKEDATGQMIELPPGYVLKVGANGSGIAICPSDPTYEVGGQIKTRKKEIKTESRRPSSLDLLRGLKKWAESGNPMKNIFRIY